ncbi:hypothetical protein Rxycam_01840 [Rubrobacter xylanophilus DSM 9941]|uniref:C40 family peptidase n=1 Tax=Rubrobacter xylanophilus TaxID=49319 RepID=UPI001C6441D7|nr:C40 family peptidase [Rubrobacter xylanophilus]QYJ16010.1 hypothetical protein Rxycam_01840 [Rubrobacter xylanophilus DSM 9941]
MPRRLSLIVFLGVLLGTLLATGITAGASPQDVREKRAEVASARDRLVEIRQEAASSYEAYNQALYQLNRLDARISATREDLAAAERRYAEARKELEERASQVYRSGNVAFLDVLVGVDSFAEFSARLDLWLRLLQEEQAELAAVRQAKQELETRQAALESQREERLAALREAAEQKERAEQAQREAQAYLGSLNRELQAAIRAEEQRQAELARRAAEKAAQEAAEIVPVANTAVAPAVTQAELEARRQAAAEARRRAEELAERRAAQQEAAERAARQAELAERRAAQQEAAERREAARRAREAARQAAIEQEAAERAAQQAAAQQEAAERAAQQQAAEQQAQPVQQVASDQTAPQQQTASPGTSSSPAGQQYPSSSGGGSQQPSTGGGGSTGVSGEAIVAEARKYLGVPYVYGGASPDQGFDCSGLVMYVFAQFGISLPHSAAAQYGYGYSVSTPGPGDVVFWAQGGGGITHDGIATGSGTVIHAPYPGTVVREEAIWSDGYVGAKRLI